MVDSTGMSTFNINQSIRDYATQGRAYTVSYFGFGMKMTFNLTCMHVGFLNSNIFYETNKQMNHLKM